MVESFMAEMSASDVLSFFRREKALVMSVLTAAVFMGFGKHWFDDLSHIAGEHPDIRQRQDQRVTGCRTYPAVSCLCHADIRLRRGAARV